MPVEIKELVVRAVVPAGERERGAPPAGGAALSQAEREAMLDACVKEVLKILRRSKER